MLKKNQLIFNRMINRMKDRIIDQVMDGINSIDGIATVADEISLGYGEQLKNAEWGIEKDGLKKIRFYVKILEDSKKLKETI